MMTRPIFQAIWNFNAVVIACASTLAITVGSYATYTIAREVLAERTANGLARAAPDTATPDTQQGELTVGNFSKLSGTKVMWAPLTLSQHYAYRLSSKHAQSVSNYMLYEVDSGRTRRLLNSNKQLIVAGHHVHRTSPRAENTAPALLAFEIIEKDTNGDGILNHEDVKRIAIARPDGRDLTRLPQMFEAFLGSTAATDGTVVLFARTSGRTKALHINPKSLSVVAENEINDGI